MSEEINFLYMKQSGYQPLDIISRSNSFFNKTGVRVNVFFVEYKDRYKFITDSSRKKNPDFDVVLVDVIWKADFIKRGIIEVIPDVLSNKIKAGIKPEIYKSFEYQNRLYAFPFHADFQLFFTNTLLLRKAGFSNPPSTIEDMVEIARTAKNMGLIKYPIFDSWDKQETLVCDYIWIVGAFGGGLEDINGKTFINSKECLKALKFMVMLLDDGLVNPYSLHSEENFVNEVFLAGDCLFTTNWMYLVELIRKSSKKINSTRIVSGIPVSRKVIKSSGKKNSTICGFEGLAVMSNSKNKRRAWEFIDFLASPDFQEKHIDFLPVWEKIWYQKETLKKDPYIWLKRMQFRGINYRPADSEYLRVSKIIQDWIYRALLKEISPEKALLNAQKEINSINR